MSEPIAPALTPEEWADFPNWPLAARPEGEDAPLYFPTRHGIAAANLHGQPFGFTREDVETLRENLSLQRGALCGFPEDAPARRLRERTESILSRIEALLPPAP